MCRHQALKNQHTWNLLRLLKMKNKPIKNKIEDIFLNSAYIK